MSNPYITRNGGATVTVFVPYDCKNNCPFCINKQEYACTEGFSAEKICQSIRTMHEITPECDFVFTGGEPLADLDSLQSMLDIIPATHRIFVNTTLPLMQSYTTDDIVSFLNRNVGKITCINVSRHTRKYVVEGDDDIFDRIEVPKRINCVLFGEVKEEKISGFINRFQTHGLPIQFRSDYTHTTPENLYDIADDQIYQLLDKMLGCTGASGCRMRCNFDFGNGNPAISYHKTLPYSTVTVQRNGKSYDILYDIIVKQNGDIHSDWTGVKLDVEAYRKVVFEPYDLHAFNTK